MLDFFVLLVQIGIFAFVLLFGVYGLSKILAYFFGERVGSGFWTGFMYLVITAYIIWAAGYTFGIF